MTHPSDRLDPRSVTDLFERYLREQIQAQSCGLGFPQVGEEVTPYETAPVQPIDPQLAWGDALRASEYLPGEKTEWPLPPEWPSLVQQQEPLAALAFALGNYPQLVRHVHPLLTEPPAALRLRVQTITAAPALLAWARQHTREPARLLAAGVLRLAGQYDSAADLLQHQPSPAWQPLHANERAALDWHQGRHEAALATWLALPDSLPVRFNRGMAGLFLGQPALAREQLAPVIAALPETSAWHHLACLYAMMAEG
ncbi:MAG: hypothetical protein U0840_30450 [Gemmataceae bacterium]